MYENPLEHVVGKEEAHAILSPLPRVGQFRLFTDVPVPGIERLRSEYLFRGVVHFDLHGLLLYFNLFSPQNI